MHVTNLSLEQFRSYARAELRPGDGLTVLEGRNAAGKTNLLEALWMLGGAKSPRAGRDDQVVRDGAPAARLACRFASEGRERELVLLVEHGHTTRKRWRLQRAPTTTAEVLGELSVVLFRPDDLDLLSRSASYRRTYLDQLLARGSREHAQLIRRVEQVLTQRRAALEVAQQGGSVDLDSLDEQLARHGGALAALRRELVAALVPIVSDVHATVAGGADVSLQLSNASLGLSAADVGQDAGAISDAFRGALADSRQHEVAAGRNLVGPQRDDLEVSVNGRALREFGSRGEWRTAVVALKLAELEHLSAARTERPILLLDDVLSELDAARRLALEPWFAKQQTILATTDRHELSAETLEQATVLRIEDGTVRVDEASREVQHAHPR